MARPHNDAPRARVDTGEPRTYFHVPGTQASSGPRIDRRMTRADAPLSQSKRRSRTHFVATHFSPASTGEPPCSERVSGCGRS